MPRRARGLPEGRSLDDAMMRKELKGFGGFGGIGLELVLSILLGYLGGRWLDGKLGTQPWLTLVGFLLGTAAGFRGLFRAWKEMQAVARREEREQGNPAPMFPKEERKRDEPPIDDAPTADESPEAKSSSDSKRTPDETY